MKKYILPIMIFALLFIVGCSKEAPSAVNSEVSDVRNDEVSGGGNSEAVEAVKEEIQRRDIVWLGDSLTQGSLGHENDNLDNSPARKLEQLSGLTVDDYGFYGYNTHDIFWVYRDETQKNQTLDPEKIYVFWVGSNDWVKDGVPNCFTAPVIEEIDTLISNGGLRYYVVMGTTARYELSEKIENGLTMYQAINTDLQELYGDHYMDVCDVITEKGYGPDNIHLTQKAYDAVAQKLYEKLKTLKYIE